MFEKNSLIGIFTFCFLILSGCSGERPSTFKNAKEKSKEEVAVNKSENDDVQSLMDAITIGDEGKVKKYLSEKMDPNTKDDLGNTPLIVSVQYGEIGIIKLLLEAGADPNIHDDLDISPLAMATENNNKEIAELLKKHGAK